MQERKSQKPPSPSEQRLPFRAHFPLLPTCWPESLPETSGQEMTTHPYMFAVTAQTSKIDHDTEEEDPHPPSRTSHPIWLVGLSQATCNMPAVEDRATVRISSPIDEEPHPASPSKTDCQVWNKTLGSRLPTSQYPSVQCGAQYPYTSLCYPRIRRRSALRRSTFLLISIESKLVHVATTTSINKRGEQ